jgi:peptidoglycan/LPS O-acetylase OafA/YrhL
MSYRVQPANIKPAPNARFAGIDGLRGVACLMVLWFHVWYCLKSESVWQSVTIGSHHLSLWRPLTLGYGGVDIFFVLSGFCLSFPVFSRTDRPVRWDKYFVSRVRRIVPPYWAALLLFASMSLLARHYRVDAYFGDELEWPGKTGIVLGAVFWKRVLSWPFWTLVVEWRWYFVFPLCIWLCRKAGGLTLVLVSILLSAVSMWLKFGAGLGWTIDWTQGVFRYLPLFAFGMYAAELALSGGRTTAERFIVDNARWGLLLCLAALLLLPPDSEQMWIWQGTIRRISTFGILAFFATVTAVRDVTIARILGCKPLVWIGSFSYSLYLVHLPFVQLAAHISRRYARSGSELLVMYAVVAPVVIILGAYLFFLLFERPFLRRRPDQPAGATQTPLHVPLLDAAVL